MKIVTTPPPNFDAIKARFDIEGKPVVFTYGDTIHNLSGNPVPDHLMAHEQVHEWQQMGSPEAWWGRYLVDAEFRLSQEIPAFRAQYRFACEHGLTDRNQRFLFARELAWYLAGPMYGNAMSPSAAVQAITS